jgi:cellulose synthase operon protein C
MIRSLVIAGVLAAILVVSGCQSAEEKAEDYYRSGLTYLEQGDTDRAIIELRNVFQYNGFHKEARKTYADILVSQGKLQEAYSQYLRLIEQYPDTVEVRRILAELAIDNNSWDEAERHGNAALALTPDAVDLQPIRLALTYRKAVLDDDAATIAALAAEASDRLDSFPESLILRRIVIDNLITDGKVAAALPVLDAAIVQMPKRLDLQMLRFSLLTQMNDTDASGEQLQRMAELFPDNIEVRNALIGWYMTRQDFDGAEIFLRKIAGPPEGPVDGHLAVIQLLQASQGTDAARAELEALLAANTATPNADLYGAMIAMLDFDAGKSDIAIATMEGIIAAAEPSDQTRKIEVLLARVLNITPANRTRATELVESVLAADPGNVEALKLRASWAIDADRVGDAIVDLRAALDQSPRDAQVLTLMAAAHERDGSPDLAGERLAMAVEVTGGGADESLRYAQFLANQGRVQAIEAVLTNARNVSPNNPDIQAALARYYIQQAQWPRAEETVAALAALPLTEQGTALVRQLRAAILAGQSKFDESLAVLQEGMSEDEPSAAVLAIVQTQVRAGKLAEARTYLDSILAKTPDDINLRLISGSLDALMEKPAAAETVWRALIAEDPTAETPVRLLYGLLFANGRFEDATAVLDAGLTAMPASGMLRWIKAGELERAGDVNGAIAVYETLYAENSSSAIVANNLASLISTYRNDDAGLARAETIARRLRGTTEPAFQDTFGWIAFRRGNLDDALRHLEPAAAALSQDPLVQFHLGMTYDALGQRDDAITQMTLALELAGKDSTLPQMIEAQAVIKRLQTAAP